ncbi:unnamed protein product [Linum trigynum]|uniref:Uncharacterized protein n=1 Tax=Linum trigynum TaxID=586398 RepID=A0AAV2DSJ0_9ROSI
MPISAHNKNHNDAWERKRKIRLSFYLIIFFLRPLSNIFPDLSRRSLSSSFFPSIGQKNNLDFWSPLSPSSLEEEEEVEQKVKWEVGGQAFFALWRRVRRKIGRSESSEETEWVKLKFPAQ